MLDSSNQTKGNVNGTTFGSTTSGDQPIQGTPHQKFNANNTNKGYLFAHCLVLGLGMFQFGVLCGQWNSVSIVFKYMEDWDQDHNTRANALVTTFANLGAMIGAFLAPVFKKEKKTMIIVCNLINIIALGVQALPMSMVAIFIGKFFQGVVAGAFTVYCPAFILEMAPCELMGPLGGINQAMTTFGIFVPSVMSIPIPGDISTEQGDRSYENDFLVSQYWRFIVLVPAVISVFQILMLLTCFNYNSPTELKKNRQDQELLTLMRKCYTTESEVQIRMHHIDADEADAGGHIEHITYMQAMTDERYAKATWVGATTMSFAQLTGINAIIFFSSQIFSSSGMSPFVALSVIAIVNFLAAIASMIALNYLGKRPVMLISQVICIGSMTGMYFFTVSNQSNLMLTMAIIFICAFELGPGSIGWAYVAEICSDKGRGVSSIMNWFWTLVVGVMYPYLNGVWIKQEGAADLIFVGASVLGFVFYWIYFLETRGKSSAELKRLFRKENNLYQKFEQEEVE